MSKLDISEFASVSNSSSACIICLDEKQETYYSIDALLECKCINTTYCKDCLNEFISQRTSNMIKCPTCRQEFVLNLNDNNYDSINNNNGSDADDGCSDNDNNGSGSDNDNNDNDNGSGGSNIGLADQNVSQVTNHIREQQVNRVNQVNNIFNEQKYIFECKYDTLKRRIINLTTKLNLMSEQRENVFSELVNSQDDNARNKFANMTTESILIESELKTLVNKMSDVIKEYEKI